MGFVIIGAIAVIILAGLSRAMTDWNRVGQPIMGWGFAALAVLGCLGLWFSGGTGDWNFVQVLMYSLAALATGTAIHRAARMWAEVQYSVWPDLRTLTIACAVSLIGVPGGWGHMLAVPVWLALPVFVAERRRAQSRSLSRALAPHVAGLSALLGVGEQAIWEECGLQTTPTGGLIISHVPAPALGRIHTGTLNDSLVASVLPRFELVSAGPTGIRLEPVSPEALKARAISTGTGGLVAGVSAEQTATGVPAELDRW